MYNKKRPMSDSEIVREYLAAKEPGKQIRILADENLCTPETIRNILRREGIPIGRKEPEAKPEQRPLPELPELPEPVINQAEALSKIVRHGAVEAIAELLAKADHEADGYELKFREQVRGVLCLVHVLEMEEQDETDETEE